MRLNGGETTDSLRVLIVEDGPDDALMIVRQLQGHFLRVEYRRVETEASLELALNNSWDVILCDYFVPDLPWPVALRLAQNRMSNVPFIVVSGLVGEDDAGLAAIRDGAWDVLSKTHLGRLGHVVKRERLRAMVISENYAAKMNLVESLKAVTNHGIDRI